MTKRIVLCADDYGQALHISQGILELIKNHRISATSCMVNQADWPLHAEWLLPYHGHIDIGLHFNLTEGRPLSDLYRANYGDQFLSLPNVMSRAFFRQWRQDLLFAECEAQLLQFRTVFGHFPDFIDGHQHIHQFPIVRDALLQVYQAYLNTSTPYIRVPAAKINYFHFVKEMKKWVIALMGASALEKALIHTGIPYPTSFAGIYDFSHALHYPYFFRQFLSEVDDLGLIMCHPGQSPASGKDLPSAHRDPLAHSRPLELAYLLSDQSLLDIKEAEVRIGRYRQN